MKKLFFPASMLVSFFALAQNQVPTLSNVTVQNSGSNTLLFTYDLADAEADAMTVSFLAGAKGAIALDYLTGNATGDVGAGIAPGAGKQIVWDYSDYAGQAPNEFRLMLVADDLQPIDIQSLVDQVDSNQIKSELNFIEGVRHQTAGAAHLQETKDFISLQFLGNSLETNLQEFVYNGYTAQNIIGRQIGIGNSGETYVLGGHFDTVTDSPGADDNGSAVVGMLEAMRILSQYPTKKSIKYIGFDLEEAGLVGSTRYVNNGIVGGETISGMIDFEMIGYYSTAANSQTLPAGFEILFPNAYSEVASQDFKGNFITNVGKTGSSATLMQAYKANATTYVPELRVVAVEAPASWQALTPDLGRSDHAPFWVAGLPAIMLTDGANFRNPNYHTPNDKAETLNFDFMANVVKGTVATLAVLAEVQHADSWWTDTELFSPTHEAFGCRVLLSPNPVQGQLSIEWELCEANMERIILYDASGRKLQELFPNLNTCLMDVSTLESGAYFLKMTNKNGSKVERIIVE